MIRLTGVTKRYGDRTAVDDVSLSVDRGKVLSIIGPSGSGKTTLLRCVNLLETPTAGEIAVDEQVFVAGQTVSKRTQTELRRKAGMVFQSFNLFPHLTLIRNVSLAQEHVLGRSRADADARSRELLERVGLGDKVDSYPGHCSGGQQQRAAISRALALDPSVMLFDEPTSALDPELALEVLTVVRQLAEDGMTMLLITHEMNFARHVSDEVAMMADGRLVERGVPAQVFEDPQMPRTQQFLKATLNR